MCLKMYKAFFLDDKHNNCGDMLSRPILQHFLKSKIKLVNRNTKGKILAVGSIMTALRKFDIVWGAGCIRDKPIKVPEGVKILALRGKYTAELLNVKCDVYGDPALLLPLMYNPNIKPKYEVGYVPHYVDKCLFEHSTEKVIDIQQDWKPFVDEIKQCKKIISSSLHGLVIAEAYGIPVEWQVYSNKVIGDGFKFKDYLSATDRESFDESLDKSKLKSIQDNLIKAIQGADV